MRQHGLRNGERYTPAQYAQVLGNLSAKFAAVKALCTRKGLSDTDYLAAIPAYKKLVWLEKPDPVTKKKFRTEVQPEEYIKTPVGAPLRFRIVARPNKTKGKAPVAVAFCNWDDKPAFKRSDPTNGLG